MTAGSFFEIAFTLAIAGGLVTLGLVWLADYRSWLRYVERLNHQLALAEAERSYGDVAAVPEEARGGRKGSGEKSGIKAARAQGRTSDDIARRHEGGTTA